jgi:hypothetical protein
MFASTATISPTGRTGIAMTAAAMTQSNARRASSSVLIGLSSLIPVGYRCRDLGGDC